MTSLGCGVPEALTVMIEPGSTTGCGGGGLLVVQWTKGRKSGSSSSIWKQYDTEGFCESPHALFR